ncbi:MAG TPA: hypothetical protein VD968_01995, partial [Pyrinomonadaceae bacterium]|nr:hypothetical protein [Pyrinomonadaceae bacterium]
FFPRLRGQLAAALGALALRPALASSLALVVVGVAVGALWFGRSTRQPEGAPSPKEVASSAGSKVDKPGAPSPVETGTGAPTVVTPGAGDADNNAVAAVPRQSARPAANGRAVITNASAPAEAVAAPTGDVIEVLEEHPVRQDDPLLAILPKQLEDPDEIIAAAGPLGPEQKEVARHVEKAEALLRSFRNVNYSAPGEAGAEGLAYERRLSRKLLEENTSLQLEAETAGDKETRRVLSALEPFLLDISNMREKPTREEVRSIKRRMEKQEIIAALQVY